MDAVTLLQVNSESMNFRSWMNQFKLNGTMPQLQAEMVKQLLIQEAAREAGLTMGEDERKAAINAWRRQSGLLQVDVTEQWMAQNKLNMEDVEEYIERQWLTEAWKARITEGQVEPYFEAHQTEFVSAEIAQIVVGSAEEIDHVKIELEQDPSQFEALARKHSIDQYSGHGGYIGEVSREVLKPEFAEAIFQTEPGRMVGPLMSNLGYHVIHVRRIKQPVLDQERVEQIKDRLLDDWLAKRYDEANVTFSF